MQNSGITSPLPCFADTYNETDSAFSLLLQVKASAPVTLAAGIGHGRR